MYYIINNNTISIKQNIFLKKVYINQIKGVPNSKFDE